MEYAQKAELRRQANEIIGQLSEILDRVRDERRTELTPEENTTCDRLEAQLTEIFTKLVGPTAAH